MEDFSDMKRHCFSLCPKGGVTSSGPAIAPYRSLPPVDLILIRTSSSRPELSPVLPEQDAQAIGSFTWTSTPSWLIGLGEITFKVMPVRSAMALMMESPRPLPPIFASPRMFCSPRNRILDAGCWMLMEFGPPFYHLAQEGALPSIMLLPQGWRK
jgi:hypothetical protein